jgi:ABC-2 type transport system ATP-binding protein
VRDERAIVAEGLSKRFGQVHALRGIDLELPVGTVLGLLGPNGAGKTTTVRILSTLLPPDAGRARVAGFDVMEQASAVRRLTGLSGQYAAVDAYLTGRENLQMIGRLYGLGRRASRRRAGELLERFDLAGAAERMARTYSGGCAAAWTSPPASWQRRQCCSWTSRPPGSIPAAAPRCGSCSAS